MAQPRRNLMMTLGKVIAAAAWADGDVDLDEVNALKDMLLNLPLTILQWAELDIYIESPVGPEERARLVEDLRDALRSKADRDYALQILREVMEADGKVTEAEETVLRHIEAALNTREFGLFGEMTNLIDGPLRRRQQAIDNAPNREQHIEDFVKNRIYYEVRRRLELGEADLNIPDDQLRRLSLAGALMAQIAFVTREVDERERIAIAQAFQDVWSLNEKEARVIAEIATAKQSIEFDKMRLAREFLQVFSREEVLHFIDALFSVAAADGVATFDQIQEIRSISRSLLVGHEEFIEAKLKIPKDKRED